MVKKKKIFRIKSSHLALVLILLIAGINVVGAVRLKEIPDITETEQLESLQPDLFAENISSGITCVLFYNEDTKINREMEQNLVKIREDYKDQICFYKVDMEKVSDPYFKHNIPGTPSVLIYKDGIEKGGIMGLSSVSNLRSVLNRYQ